MPRYWIITTSPDNLARTAAQGWTVQGFKSRQRKKVMDKMRPGDRLAWYLTGVKALGALATVTSEPFEDHSRVWVSDGKPDEDYAWRVHIQPDLVLAEADWLPLEPIARDLAHVRKWPAENWTLAFQGNLREVSADDFAVVERALRQAAPAPA
ncbi:MAG: EVE domain-containing protein [Anaerolineae bacterium]|nr:EVE domain-containing protein [Anaerolineae bacterium]